MSFLSDTGIWLLVSGHIREGYPGTVASVTACALICTSKEDSADSS
jgi:hypothetical protein